MPFCSVSTFATDSGVRSWVAATSVAVRVPLPSAIVTCRRSPALAAFSTVKSSCATMSSALRPFSDTMTSPRLSPASAAGESGST